MEKKKNLKNNSTLKSSKKWSRNVVFRKHYTMTPYCQFCGNCPDKIKNGYKPCPYLDAEYFV